MFATLILAESLLYLGHTSGSPSNCILLAVRQSAKHRTDREKGKQYTPSCAERDLSASHLKNISIESLIL